MRNLIPLRHFPATMFFDVIPSFLIERTIRVIRILQ